MFHSSQLVFISVAAVLALACGTGPEVSPSTSPLASSAVITLPADITSLSAINRSPAVAAGLADGQVVVWNGRDAAPAVVLKPHVTRVLAVGSTADGREVWSVADGSLARTAIAPNGQSTSLKLDLGSAPTRAAAFSADGAMLVTGGEFGDIRVFDTASGTLRQLLRGHRTELQSLAVRPGTTSLASASAEADLRIWDTTGSREIGSIDGNLSLFALAFSPRDGTLASGGVDRRLTLHDPVTFQPVSHLALQAPKMVATLAWSPDGQLIVLGDIDDETLSKGGIQIVNASTRAVTATLETSSVPAGALVFAGDGEAVIAALGRELRAWSMATVSSLAAR